MVNSEPRMKNQILKWQEMRPKVVAECTLKESAAINQILGRKVRNIFENILKYF